ncbi:alpha/beta fold hydrolase [Marinobacter sp. 71-i]|uniref:Alpha/beta fold hydrolase n=1 Tax=Marinobacter iranensis TaxID=2962607 RepID=A0ABT5Y5B5_9GAMM|nr:alpha/beta fold hydrolase [Marinobacter iranensis]MDF0748861.1 alpha/beta fold hydrolase [Marinobacter iranensis]
MSAVGPRTPLVVVGGWGVDAAMLLPLFDHWPGEIHLVSLNDVLMSRCDSITAVADYLLARYPCPSVWAGWSQGAHVAMAAAARSSLQVRRVITLAGFPRFIASAEWPLGMAAATFETFREEVARNAGRAWKRFQHLLIHGSDDESEARQELRPWLERGPVGNAASLVRGLEWLSSENQLSLWRDSPVPVLHLQAGRDAVVQCWNGTFSSAGTAEVIPVPAMTHWPRGPALKPCREAIRQFVFSKENQWPL